MESLIFLSEKKDGTTKCLVCANGSVHRSCTSKEEASSLNMDTESVLIKIISGAKQERNDILRGMPSALAQVKTPQSEEITIMNIRGSLVGMLLEIDPEKCQDFVIIKVLNKKITCTH